MTAAEFALRVLDVMGRADLRNELFWRTDGEYAPVTFWINCSDLFTWGTADLEPVTPTDLPALEQALADVAAICGSSSWGAMLYCARRRSCRPQGASYPSNRNLWPLFDACGPEREIGLGNPYLPGRVKPRTAAYDDLRRHLFAVHHNLAALNLTDEEAREEHRDEHRKLWRHEPGDLSWTGEQMAASEAARREMDGE